jgi:hypothetical protein
LEVLISLPLTLLAAVLEPQAQAQPESQGQDHTAHKCSNQHAPAVRSLHMQQQQQQQRQQRQQHQMVGKVWCRLGFMPVLGCCHSWQTGTVCLGKGWIEAAASCALSFIAVQS